MTPVIWFRTQKNRFKRTFFAGTRKCPHNLNRPHFAGVYSYECPHKCAAVSAHIHTHTHTHTHTQRNTNHALEIYSLNMTNEYRYSKYYN